MKKIFILITDRFKSLYKKYGWKAVAGLFMYYLIRDVTLYILLPLYIFSKIG